MCSNRAALEAARADGESLRAELVERGAEIDEHKKSYANMETQLSANIAQQQVQVFFYDVCFVFCIVILS